MNQLELETPVIINGVIVTDDILQAIDMLHFGGCYGRDIRYKEFDPERLKKYQSDCKDLSFHLLQKAIDNAERSMSAEDMEVFEKIHWLHELLDYFNIPEKLIEKLKSKNLLR